MFFILKQINGIATPNLGFNKVPDHEKTQVKGMPFRRITIASAGFSMYFGPCFGQTIICLLLRFYL